MQVYKLFNRIIVTSAFVLCTVLHAQHSLGASAGVCPFAPAHLPGETRSRFLPELVVSGEELRFGAMGDWGVSGSGNADGDERLARALASVIGATGERLAWPFLLTLGDHFYGPRPQSADDKLWGRVAVVSQAHPFLTRLPWMGVLGNHDWDMDDPQGLAVLSQLQRTARGGYWCMPDLFYSFRVQLPEFAVRFIGLDTNLWLHQCNGGCQTETPAYCELGQAPAPALCQAAFIPSFHAVRDFLEAALQEGQARGDVLVVYGHHPLVSVGLHGLQEGANGGYPEIREELTPLLERYNVALYLAGHEHLSQVLRSTAGPLNVVTGRMGKTNDFVRCDSAGDCNARVAQRYGTGKFEFVFASADEGFAAVRIRKDEVEVSLLGLEHKLLTKVSKKLPPPVAAKTSAGL